MRYISHCLALAESIYCSYGLAKWSFGLGTWACSISVGILQTLPSIPRLGHQTVVILSPRPQRESVDDLAAYLN